MNSTFPDYMFLSENNRKFLDAAIDYCEENNINIYATPESFVYTDDYETVKASGYFYAADDESGELAIAVGLPYWFTIFVHEFGHATQWVDTFTQEDTPYSQTDMDFDGYHIDAGALIELWLKEIIELSDEVLKDAMLRVLNMELDADCRAIQMIRAWNLDMDVEDYIKRSNAYIFFYRYMLESRTWYDPDNKPYENKNIVKNMPTTVDIDHMSSKYDDIMELFRKEKI